MEAQNLNNCPAKKIFRLRTKLYTLHIRKCACIIYLLLYRLYFLPVSRILRFLFFSTMFILRIRVCFNFFKGICLLALFCLLAHSSRKMKLNSTFFRHQKGGGVGVDILLLLPFGFCINYFPLPYNLHKCYNTFKIKIAPEI